jgi:hypothetical protein
MGYNRNKLFNIYFSIVFLLFQVPLLVCFKDFPIQKQPYCFLLRSCYCLFRTCKNVQCFLKDVAVSYYSLRSAVL